MRITNKTLSNNFLADMQRNLENLSKIQQQVSSTKNFSKPSDDPINVERAMQLQSSVNYTTQYGSNIKTANTWMQTTDTTLGQIGTVLSNIRKNLEQAGGVYKQDEKDKINDAVNQEVQQIATLLNTNFQGEYIFGGTAGLSKPITTTTDANGIVTLEYADKDGNAVTNLPNVVSNGFDVNNWIGKSITFNVNGTDYQVDLKSSYPGIDDVVKDLNSQIQGKTGLTDKINVVKTNDGNVKFIAVNNSDNIKLSTDISDMSRTFSGTSSAQSNGFTLSNWTGKNIAFDVNGTSATLTVGSSDTDIDSVISDLSSQLKSNSTINGKISISKTGDGSIKFTAANGSDSINIDPTNTTVGDMTNTLFGTGEVVSSGFKSSNWQGTDKNITFTDGTNTPVKLTPSGSTASDIVSNLNSQIQSSSLKGKVNFQTDGTNIKVMINGSDINMTTNISDISPQLSNMTMENIGADKSIEISQGVVLTYNATASDIMQYGNDYNTTSGDSINALVDRIQHHLAGQVLRYTDSNNNPITSTTPGAVLVTVKNDGGAMISKYGVWTKDANSEDDAKKELMGQDLVDIDAASKKVLQVRSKIGAKEKRMGDLSTQNAASITDLKEVLSKTEDIDITQKTIEYYTSITVYQACLQTGGKVIQPTLLDYIR
ncbi:hypothetical protein [Clostridium sp. AWRP]|uniref:flagellin N-terminal helical domain-containing protein n=1 Tax=Clostridium sp. AWRP TaxID=2212991 RepID=UPI001FA9577B|nr:hypothetical protein [Clostridium sp. AWRP]